MTSSRIALLAQADLLLFLAEAFREPSEGLNERFLNTDFDSRALVFRAGGDGAVRAPFDAVRAELKGFDRRRWSEEFTLLFDGHVECPINEAGFVRRDKGAILGDIAGFYHAFGFRLADDCTERVDHLVCELEFVAMLLVLLAQAEESGHAEKAAITRDALRAFAFAHPGEWLPAFCVRLKESASLPYYRHLAALLEGVWTLATRQNELSVPDKPNLADTREEDGTPYECDMAEAGMA